MARQNVKTVTGTALNAQGEVQAVSSIERSTKRGPQLVYSFKIDDTWYKTGFTDPEVKQGDSISFSYEETKWGKEVDVDSITEIEAVVKPVTKALPKPTASKKPNVFKTSGNKDGYWEEKAVKDDDRQVLITFQASRNAAIELVAAALRANAIVLPKEQKKQLDSVVAYVTTLTEKFFVESSDIAALKTLLITTVNEGVDESSSDTDAEEAAAEGSDD